MPRTATDYSRTVIYKIEHNENKELVYVGSTTDFTKRKYSHKNTCNNEKGKHYNLKVYHMIRENGGWEAFQMLEIKKFPCYDSNEARAEEERCRVELKSTMNMIRAFVTETQQEYDKNLYEKNKIIVKSRSKNRYDEHRDEINKRSSEKVSCECGSIYSIGHKARHFESKKHNDNVYVFANAT
jgi:hypothetical protein